MDRSFFGFVTIYAFDRQTGGRTERQTDILLMANTVLYSMQRGKKEADVDHGRHGHYLVRHRLERRRTGGHGIRRRLSRYLTDRWMKRMACTICCSLDVLRLSHYKKAAWRYREVYMYLWRDSFVEIGQKRAQTYGRTFWAVLLRHHLKWWTN